ncbi:MAG TPA: hypothetical protein VIS27_00430 [Yeosuana sp.]
MPQNIPIQIIGIDPTDSTKLILSDNGNSNVDPGDTVTWSIKSGSGVASITNIYADSGSTDVFNPDPSSQGSSGNWRGTVNPALNSGFEDYTICWTSASGTSACFDPRITINSTHTV